MRRLMQSLWRQSAPRNQGGSRGAARRRFRSLAIEHFESRDLLTSVTLTPVADNTLFSDQTSHSDGIGPSLFSGETVHAGVRRALLKFDVAGNVPAGAHIDSVTLQLHVVRDKGVSHAFGVNLMLASWGEGTSNSNLNGGDGAAATTNDATWLARFFNASPAQAWTNQGGDFNSTASATTTVGGINFFQWTGTQLAADVQGWLNSPSTQLGWMIKEVDESVSGSAEEFDSRESPTAANRPTLTINFTAGNAAPVVAGPTTASVTQAGTLSFNGAKTISVSDTDGGSSTESVALAVTSGTITLTTSGVTVTSGTNSSGAVTISGTLANLNAALATLAYLAPNSGTSATLTATANDGTASSNTLSVAITISTPVNQPPVINPISNPPAIAQDAGLQTIGLTGISAGAGESQELSVTTASDNVGLIPNPTVSYSSPNATGSLSYTPVAGQSGTAKITVIVRDAGLDGVLGNTDDGSIAKSFTVQVLSPAAINHAPSFVKGGDQSATDEDGATSVPGWATAISPGPAAESTQTVSFLVSTNNDALFSVKPAVDPTGKLTFTPAPNLHGTAHVSVHIKDSGGTAAGGVDTSSPQTFDIVITKPHPFHNTAVREDVTDPSLAGPPDGHIVAGDALAIINFINSFDSRAVPAVPFTGLFGPPYLDVDADNFVAPGDALDVINVINAGLGGEWESPNAPPLAESQAPGSQAPRNDDLLALLFSGDNAAPQGRRRA